MKPFLITAAFAAMLMASSCATPNRNIQQPEHKVAVRTTSRPQQKLESMDYIVEKRRTTEPFAHVMFCEKTPGDCRNSGGPDVVNLTNARDNELSAVNRSVNSQIKPTSDRGDDTWTLAPASGDCEDYAVTKRHILIQRGWPSSALRLAIGKTPEGEGHLVLVVHTNEGDLVLDNLSNDIETWRDTSLSWQSIQSSSDPRIWFRI